MHQKTYKIILDTNFIYYDQSYGLGTLFSSHLEQLVEFIKIHSLSSVKICIPEMVIKERIAQKVAQTETFREDSTAALKSLETINLQVGNKKFEKTNLVKAFKKKVDEIVKSNNIEIIPIPNIKNSEIVERVLTKTPPFTKNNKSDAGYKDTIIWLSVLEDAKQSSGAEYVFCTNNTKDFISDICIKEFKEAAKANISFVPDLNELKLLLDKELVLKLDLKQLNERITDEIKQHLGDLNIEFNKFLRKEFDPFDMRTAGSAMAYDYISGRDKRGSVKGYNAIDFTPTNINQNSKNIFNIEGNLEVKEVVENQKDDPLDIYPTTYTAMGRYHSNYSEERYVSFVWNDRDKAFSAFFTRRTYRSPSTDPAWSIA